MNIPLIPYEFQCRPKAPKQPAGVTAHCDAQPPWSSRPRAAAGHDARRPRIRACTVMTKNAMLLRAAAHVQQHAVWTALRDEYRTLERDGRMHPQQECIEHVRFDGDVSHLLWHQFSATVRAHSAAADHSSKPVGQIMTGGLWCATELTPVACNLLNTLSVKFKLQMLHAGYSALSAGGQLREHFGQTNAQLKWHLGLIVPSAPTHDCVWLQVDGQLRAPGWTEGQLTIFDDSFAHAAGNNCAEKRVVLQLVMKHPGIW
jgi:hypothetical protein